MNHFGGMQLLPDIKKTLNPLFLHWYLSTFTSARMCYIHWSAGHRDQNFDDYHAVVTVENGTVLIHRNTPYTTDLHAHTYQRNTNSFAVCVASMVGATTENFGAEPPTPGQLRFLTGELAHACIANHVPVGNIMTHAEAADNLDGAQGLEFYGPAHTCERWDFFVEIDPTTLHIYPRGTTRAGLIYFPDWLRANVIREIATLTESHWSKPAS